MIVSLGRIDFKYFIYLIVYFVMQIYSNYILYQYSQKVEENRLLEIFLTCFGYLLIIIPALITKKLTSSDLPKKNVEGNKNNENVKNRANIKIKDIIIFFLVCILNLAIQFSYILVEILNDYFKEEYFIFIIIIWFIAPKCILKQAYYKHQKLAILFVIIIEAIKTIIIIFALGKFNYKQIFLEIFIQSANSIFFKYINIL